MKSNQNKGFKNFMRQLAIAFFIMLVVSAVFSLFGASFSEVKKINISELVSEINKGNVAKISVESNDLSIEYKNGEKASAKKEVESSLSDTLNNYGVDKAELKKVEVEVLEMSSFSFWLLNLLPILLPVVLIGLIFWMMFRKASQGTMQAFSFGKSGAKMASPKEKITFSDVAGLKDAKEELKEVVDFLKNPKKFLEIGAKIPRGVLLMGSPGTGKTLLARAVSGEANVPFFHISGSEFVEMFVGVGASRVRDTFSMAKKAAPSILFIDELDAIGRHRGAGLGGGHDEREQTLNQILVEMDGFEHDTNVIVMAATNRPDILDPALLRPGRFDRRIVLDEPDIKDREMILKIHGKNKPLDLGVNLREVAVRTPGFSGADLANLMNEAAILAARKNKKIISQSEIIESIEKVMLGPERKNHLLSAKEKEIAAYHEAGHAVVAAVVPSSDPVHKISIIARGMAAGYTLKLPEEERRMRTKSQFLADLAVTLGGYVAEQLVFGELTTGASNDLQKTTQLARYLVTQYGMSEKLGPRTFGEKEELVFLGKEIHEKRNYSEETASKIDKEVDKFISDAYKTAQNILKSKKSKLKEVAEKLIQKETIEKEEFEEIMGIKSKKDVKEVNLSRNSEEKAQEPAKEAVSEPREISAKIIKIQKSAQKANDEETPAILRRKK